MIADRIKNQFPDLNVQIGGQTGLDISDSDKSQIIKYFNYRDEIHFFGDMMEEGQNDYPLARKRTMLRVGRKKPELTLVGSPLRLQVV